MTHMAVDSLIQCHSSRDDKKIGSNVQQNGSHDDQVVQGRTHQTYNS